MNSAALSYIILSHSGVKNIVIATNIDISAQAINSKAFKLLCGFLSVSYRKSPHIHAINTAFKVKPGKNELPRCCKNCCSE